MIRFEETTWFESCPFIRQGISCGECGIITRPCYYEGRKEIPEKTRNGIWDYKPPKGQVKNTIRTARRLLQEISNDL